MHSSSVLWLELDNVFKIRQQWIQVFCNYLIIIKTGNIHARDRGVE